MFDLDLYGNIAISIIGHDGRHAVPHGKSNAIDKQKFLCGKSFVFLLKKESCLHVLLRCRAWHLARSGSCAALDVR